MYLRHLCAGLVLVGAFFTAGCTCCHHACRPAPAVSAAPPCCAPAPVPAPCCGPGAIPVPAGGVPVPVQP
jgi:hypothetical protein